MKNTFKQITGGKDNTSEEVYNKFPWFKKAIFNDAIVDISNNYLVWEGGTWEGGWWKGGVWEGGMWEGGVWEGGTWEGGMWKGGMWKGGVWEGGMWKGGVMWSNIEQEYQNVIQKNGKLNIKN